MNWVWIGAEIFLGFVLGSILLVIGLATLGAILSGIFDAIIGAVDAITDTVNVLARPWNAGALMFTTLGGLMIWAGLIGTGNDGCLIFGVALLVIGLVAAGLCVWKRRRSV